MTRGWLSFSAENDMPADRTEVAGARAHTNNLAMELPAGAGWEFRLPPTRLLEFGVSLLLAVPNNVLTLC